tara:strand:+ start:275 stop:976 length:702 start_codon:yes stop_codon:yes gene_type:complete
MTKRFKKKKKKAPKVFRKKVCVIIRGQMFRSGGQYSRETEYSYEQMNALQSIKTYIIDPLSLFWDVIVITDVITEDARAANEIIMKTLKPCRMRTDSSFPKSQVQGWLDSIHFAKTTCSRLFIVRTDLLFKQEIPMVSLLEPEKPVLVPWQISERFGSKLSSGRDRVCDTFAFVSDTNIMIAALEQHTNESSFHSIMDWIDCGYIIPNYARDSDSAKEFNDYYRIIGRNEAKD